MSVLKQNTPPVRLLAPTVYALYTTIQRREGQPVHCAAKGSPRIAWRHSRAGAACAQAGRRLHSACDSAQEVVLGPTAGTWHCILHYLHYIRACYEYRRVGLPQSGSPCGSVNGEERKAWHMRRACH